MSVIDYTAAIRITFDLEIMTDPDIILGVEISPNKLAVLSPLSSGDYAGQGKALAFDGDTATYWRSLSATMPQWIGADFGEDRKIGQVRVYVSSYAPNGYSVQGSADGETWSTVFSGSFTSSVGWKTQSFTPATYRYWRLYVTSLHSSHLRIYELEFYPMRPTYKVAGWSVSALQYNYVPGGSLSTEQYTVKRVTRTEDHMAVILWLDVRDRMRMPVGDVTVSYQKLLGGLKGPQGARVEDFSLAFSPQNIVPTFHPNHQTRIQANLGLSSELLAVNYIPTRTDAHVSVSLVVDTDLIHIDDLEQ